MSSELANIFSRWGMMPLKGNTAFTSTRQVNVNGDECRRLLWTAHTALRYSREFASRAKDVYLGLPGDEVGVEPVLDARGRLGRLLGGEVQGWDRRGDRQHGKEPNRTPCLQHVDGDSLRNSDDRTFYIP